MSPNFLLHLTLYSTEEQSPVLTIYDQVTFLNVFLLTANSPTYKAYSLLKARIW